MNHSCTPLHGGRFSRRDFLYGLGATLGTTALNSLLAADARPCGVDFCDTRFPSPSQACPHRPSKAKACIYLFMEGGPSHIDTFDPKPKLAEVHMKEFQRADKFASAMSSGKRYYVKSPFKFAQHGQSGLPIDRKSVV